jgi:hypothetical protein
VLESIYDEFDSSIVGNQAHKLSIFTKNYINYKLKFCPEESIVFVEDKSEYTNRLSHILDDLYDWAL